MSLKKSVGCKITNALGRVLELLVLMKLNSIQIDAKIVAEVPGCSRVQYLGDMKAFWHWT